MEIFIDFYLFFKIFFAIICLYFDPGIRGSAYFAEPGPNHCNKVTACQSYGSDIVQILYLDNDI